MKSYVVINQARMTSSRLPGKVLKEVLGRPLLQYQIERLQRAKHIDAIVIATTTNPTDEPIVNLCHKLAVKVARGSELDVLDRYYRAHCEFPSTHVVRVTSDCPLHDPFVLDHCIEQFEQSGADYFSNSEAYPNGMNVEVFSAEMLRQAHQEAKISYEREHVTPYFYTHPELFKLGQAHSEVAYPRYRLTVDTPEDFDLVKKLLERLYPKNAAFTLDDICREFDRDPSLEKINAEIRQKKYYE